MPSCDDKAAARTGCPCTDRTTWFHPSSCHAASSYLEGPIPQGAACDTTQLHLQQEGCLRAQRRRAFLPSVLPLPTTQHLLPSFPQYEALLFPSATAFGDKADRGAATVLAAVSLPSSRALGVFYWAAKQGCLEGPFGHAKQAATG